MVRTDPLYKLLGTVAGAVIGLILMVFIIPIGLNVFGIYLCTGCDPLVSIFAIGVLPITAVFIIIYKVWYQFTE